MGMTVMVNSDDRDSNAHPTAWRSYPLTIGLPQTNHRNFSETSLLMEAGHCFWQALGDAIGRPVSQLRAADGTPVYAVMYFVEERFPDDRTLGSFRLDDRLRFHVALRAMGAMATEARVIFDREDRFAHGWDLDEEGTHPAVRFGSVFGGLQSRTRRLTPAAPVNADLSRLPALALEAYPSRLTREAQTSGRLGLIDADWPSLDLDGPARATYRIDPDRDTNATGLVYFANFARMLEAAERIAIPRPSRQETFCSAPIRERQVLIRRIAYYGAPGSSDAIAIEVARCSVPERPGVMALRYRLSREEDAQLIGLSEALVRLRAAESP